MVIYFNVSIMWNRAYFKEQIPQGNNITQKTLNIKEAVQADTGVPEGIPSPGIYLLTLVSLSAPEAK